MGLMAMPAFMSKTDQINNLFARLPRGQCVGYAVQVRLARPNWTSPGFVAETLTFWHDPMYSKEFFKSDFHKEGLKALRGRVEFRAHRVWV